MKRPVRSYRGYMPAVLSVLLVLGVLTVFSPCGPKEDGTFMRCRSVRSAVLLTASGIALIQLLGTFFHGRVLRAAADAVSAAGCVLLFLLPGVIMPMCMMHTMRCYTAMQPFVRILSVPIGLFSLWDMVCMLKKERA